MSGINKIPLGKNKGGINLSDTETLYKVVWTAVHWLEDRTYHSK